MKLKSAGSRISLQIHLNVRVATAPLTLCLTVKGGSRGCRRLRTTMELTRGRKALVKDFVAISTFPYTWAPRISRVTGVLAESPSSNSAKSVHISGPKRRSRKLLALCVCVYICMQYMKARVKGYRLSKQHRLASVRGMKCRPSECVEEGLGGSLTTTGTAGLLTKRLSIHSVIEKT